MEAVNSVVNAATKAIWGEPNVPEELNEHHEPSTQEPASGVQGAGTVDEPYDKGNLDPAEVVSPINESVPQKTVQPEEHHAEIPPIKKQEVKSTEPSEPPSVTQPEDEVSKPEGTKQIPSDGKKLVERGELPHGSRKSPEQPMILEDGSGHEIASEVPPISETIDKPAVVAHEGGGVLEKEKEASEQPVTPAAVTISGGAINATKLDTEKEATGEPEQPDTKDDSDNLSPDDDTASGSSSQKKAKKASKMAKLKDKLHIRGGKRT